MKKLMVSIAMGAIFGAAGLYLYAQTENRNIVPGVESSPRHPVTDDMRAEAESRTEMHPEDLKLVDSDGNKTSISEIAGGKPVFVYFIKDGCPCSTTAEPMFQELYHHLNSDEALKIPFVGIIGSEQKVAKKWVSQFKPAYPVLSAPSQDIMVKYKAPRSAFSLLLSPEGKVIKMWPGWSKGILTEINKKASEAAGIKTATFDTKYAPSNDSSGCSFDEAIAKIEDGEATTP